MGNKNRTEEIEQKDKKVYRKRKIRKKMIKFFGDIHNTRLVYKWSSSLFRFIKINIVFKRNHPQSSMDPHDPTSFANHLHPFHPLLLQYTVPLTVPNSQVLSHSHHAISSKNSPGSTAVLSSTAHRRYQQWILGI